MPRLRLTAAALRGLLSLTALAGAGGPEEIFGHDDDDSPEWADVLAACRWVEETAAHKDEAGRPWRRRG